LDWRGSRRCQYDAVADVEIPVRWIWRVVDVVPFRLEFPSCAEVLKFQSTDLCF
jgi:hypothetical protein